MTIYMPMIPEAVIAMLACARIGAVHSVVFGGFAANELAARIDDAQPVALLKLSRRGTVESGEFAYGHSYLQRPDAYALNPDIKVIAPWREWEFKSRTDLIAFAEAHQIPVAKDKRGDAPFSVDANLLHSSSEGKVLEDP